MQVLPSKAGYRYQNHAPHSTRYLPDHDHVHDHQRALVDRRRNGPPPSLLRRRRRRRPQNQPVEKRETRPTTSTRKTCGVARLSTQIRRVLVAAAAADVDGNYGMVLLLLPCCEVESRNGSKKSLSETVVVVVVVVQVNERSE